MAVNHAIVIGTIGITFTGVIGSLAQGKPIQRIVVAGYLVGLTASLVDLVPGAGPIAGGIVMTAFFGILLSSLHWLNIYNALNPSGGATSEKRSASTATNQPKG